MKRGGPRGAGPATDPRSVVVMAGRLSLWFSPGDEFENGALRPLAEVMDAVEKGIHQGLVGQRCVAGDALQDGQAVRDDLRVRVLCKELLDGVDEARFKREVLPQLGQLQNPQDGRASNMDTPARKIIMSYAIDMHL